ncbi:transcription factor Adf-1-like [Ornithodoros turicata]|uniref:transcription factor Adf-1-like n=1 Tax=Ornithodoros turicata TaxID=34597 RepID=UPI003139CA3D
MLCIEIEKHPWLYDKTRSEYKDTLKRENAWQAIARTLKLNAEECKKQWRTIRDRYARENRQTTEDRPRSGAGSDEVVTSKWSLYKYLGFLKPHLKSKKLQEQNTVDATGNSEQYHGTTAQGLLLTMINEDSFTSPTDETSHEINQNKESSGQAFESSDTYRALRDQEERNEPPTVPPHKPSERKTASGETSYLTQALAAATAEMASGSRNARLHIDDCDTMFLLSLRDSFKVLSNKKKRLAQLQIQKVLFDLEFGEESE